MHIIQARNVNDALSQGLLYLRKNGIQESSRNGTVIVAPGPVTTVYEAPMERVLFSPIRDANPFFHLMEALWMLGGRNDLAWPLFFNSRFAGYSDDGKTLHGAYGHRWRHAFGKDQIRWVVDELREHPESRRCVIGMWNPATDLGHDGKDVPCNTTIFFMVRDGKLDMTVTCRSNDILWGAYGANAVHMSMLHELVARAAFMEVGTYYQVSNNYHLYGDVLSYAKAGEMATSAGATDYYTMDEMRHVCPAKIMTVDFYQWEVDLNNFLNNPLGGTADYNDPWFARVAEPMYRAWDARKNKRNDGMVGAAMIAAPDWRQACIEWIQRRAK